MERLQHTTTRMQFASSEEGETPAKLSSSNATQVSK